MVYCFLHVLHTCIFPPDLNDTSIVLILKKDNPDKVIDMRPIFLCIVLHKNCCKSFGDQIEESSG